MDVDYYIKDSKIRDILDIPRPPIKRICKNSYQDRIGYVVNYSDKRNTVHFDPNECNTNISQRNCKFSYQDCIGYVISDSDKVNFVPNKSNKKNSQSPVRSSLSLVLKKIREKQVFEDKPLNSKNPLLLNQTEEANTNNKPTIKVTVIPKKDPECLFGYLDTKNHTKNNTTSKDKYPVPIATNNVYLVVAGKRKEKIYEVKAVGNKRFNDNRKDVRFDKNRFRSKMEKKRKKSLNVEGKLHEHKCSDANCFCSCPKDDFDLAIEDEYPGSSRVTIVGRIGLNDDDKYVMKCAATVNGQPVKTNYVPAQAIPVIHERLYERRKDIKNEKTPIHFNLSNNHQDIDSKIETTSQATQVDASMQLARFSPTTDRNTQCNLCELCNNTENRNFDDESKVINLNRSTSPLVIISVYPKPESKIYSINATDTASVNKFEKQIYRLPHVNETVKVNNFAMNTDLYNVRETSPNKLSIPRCCPCDNVIKNETKTVKDDTRTNGKTIARTNRPSRSPSPAKKTPKSKIQERKKDFMDTNTTKAKSRSPSPTRIIKNKKINERETNLSKQTKKVNTITTKTDIKKQQHETQKSKSKARDKSFNTVKEQSDKTIKKVSENKRTSIPKHTILIKNDEKTVRQIVLKKSLPKNEISKVAINIDSEKEFYDVVFEKGNVTTDLIVTRTAKDNFSQKYFKETFEQKYENREHLSDSLENFFPIPRTGQHRRSASQTFNNENNDVFPLTTHNISRLKVRDSLEICHRKDHSKDFKTHASKPHFENDTDGGKEDFYVPTKHFPGDDCIIDPIERDREIRELLGIDKRRTDKIYTADVFEHEMFRNNVISRRCILNNTLCESLAKKPILHWDSSCTDTIQNDNNVNISKRDEEKSITDDEKHNLIKLGKTKTINNTKTKKIKNVNLQNRVKVAFAKPQTTQYIDQRMLHLQSHTRNNDTSQYINREMLHIQNHTRNNDTCKYIDQEMLHLQSHTSKKDTSQCIDQEMLHLQNHTSNKEETKSQQKHKNISLSVTQYRKVKKLIQKLNEDWIKSRQVCRSIVSIGSVKATRKSDYLIHFSKNVQTDSLPKNLECSKSKSELSKDAKDKDLRDNNTDILFCKEETDQVNNTMRKAVRKVASSIEIRYTSIACMGERTERALEYSDKDIKYKSNLVWKRRDSIETIFRGHKKSFTPNLGTSSLSLLSEEVKSAAESLPIDTKSRKPFLKRLMSCLVMKSETTAMKVPIVKQKTPTTLDSSFDSYYISTSLGAMDMSSSIFDTSASFYSNHTIGVINNKTKRGFFNSVREFLSVKKN